MFYPPELLSWVEQVSTHLPHLQRSQAQMLAWYSFAVTLVQGCGISQVAYLLACLLERSENSMRQRLRETLYDAPDKRGQQRREIDVVACFAPLLHWVLARGCGPDAVLWLALDATTLRQTFTVLSVSVLVGRCAIPVAWAILPAQQPGSWKPHWLRLLTQIQVPVADRKVLVLTDRGLYAPWLFQAITRQGWHPLMRINPQGNVVLRESGARWKLAHLAAQCRQRWWHGTVLCFPGKKQLNCTLLALWDEGQREVWLLVTDLPHTQVSPTWYTLRMWIEAGFKLLKSAGFHWERTRMSHPARAERLWLVLALASLRAAMLAPPPPEAIQPLVTPYPRLSLLKQGLLRQLAALLLRRPPQFYPFHLPLLPPAPCLEFATLLKTYP